MGHAHAFRPHGGIHRQQAVPGIIAHMGRARRGHVPAGQGQGRAVMLFAQQGDEAAQPGREARAEQRPARRMRQLQMAVGVDAAGHQGHVAHVRHRSPDRHTHALPGQHVQDAAAAYQQRRIVQALEGAEKVAARGGALPEHI